MKDFVTYDIFCDLNKEQIFAEVVGFLPNFKWRQGDSDSQGPYISGMDDDDIQIKLWLGEEPVEMTISFDDVWLDTSDRDKRKVHFIELIENVIIPPLGVISKFDK
ncbi:hypothetical protein MHK_006538 [Candidatus Magnetomorum sp. HK-1]|nr:hypothetical protein MHK_006538 [Candidatus Magnetomorum sp. HK-1]